MNTTQHLEETADQLKKNRPGYEPIIDFYTRIFIAQERSKEGIRMDPVVIDPDVLSLKQKNQMPLIDQSEFPVQIQAASDLLLELCLVAEAHAPELSAAAKVIRRALAANELDLESFVDALLNSHDSSVRALAAGLDISREQLAMFGYLCIAPCIEVSREQLLSYLDGYGDFQKGYCPVCGNAPELAYFDEKGKRHVQCGFCHHQWQIQRMGCVFCENNEDGKQQYFFSEQEKEYRVYLCDSCRNYIKVVDLRQMERRFISGLEMISTLHLDMTARQKGYSRDAVQH